MLTILPMLEQKDVVPYCQKLHKIYHPGFYLYVGKDKGKRLATGLFEIQKDHVQVVYYESEDPEDIHLLDGILRAGFHYADQHGIPSGMIPISFYKKQKKQLEQLNYPSQPLFDISNFFAKYKNC